MKCYHCGAKYEDGALREPPKLKAPCLSCGYYPPVEPEKFVHMLAAFSVLNQEAKDRWMEIIRELQPDDFRRWLDTAWEMSIPEVINAMRLRIKKEKEMRRE